MSTVNAARVTGIVAKHFRCDPATLSPETHFTDDLRADSLDVVELALELEDVFDVDIPDPDIRALARVGDAIALIDRLTNR